MTSVITRIFRGATTVPAAPFSSERPQFHPWSRFGNQGRSSGLVFPRTTTIANLPPVGFAFGAVGTVAGGLAITGAVWKVAVQLRRLYLRWFNKRPARDLEMGDMPGDPQPGSEDDLNQQLHNPNRETVVTSTEQPRVIDQVTVGVDEMPEIAALPPPQVETKSLSVAERVDSKHSIDPQSSPSVPSDILATERPPETVLVAEDAVSCAAATDPQTPKFDGALSHLAANGEVEEIAAEPEADQKSAGAGQGRDVLDLGEGENVKLAVVERAPVAMEIANADVVVDTCANVLHVAVNEKGRDPNCDAPAHANNSPTHCLDSSGTCEADALTSKSQEQDWVVVEVDDEIPSSSFTL